MSVQTKSPPDHFPSGIVVFFRTLAPDGNLARSVHSTARSVELEACSLDYLLRDTDEKVVGIFPRDWVSAILPLQTVGPSYASDTPN